MKVGDYVRTKRGKIFKYVKYDKEEKQYRRTYKNDNISLTTSFRVEDVIKSSSNIIDLIEVGDYVNGCPVLHKENNEVFCGLLLRYKGENIQNVVTKEQFESMEYKVGDE